MALQVWRNCFSNALITNDPLSVLSSWNNSIHFCHWNGIRCSRRRQRVTALNLTSQHLGGKLSPHIGNLSFLREIYLSENNFHGSIPNEIGWLFRLQYLDLGSNSFQGRFPANLSHCVDIRNISLAENELEGKLPTEFSTWPKLYLLNLGSNHFTGSIPPSIGNISSLHKLSLSFNNLAAGIPSEIAHLVNLEVLVMGTNNLSGMVPLPLYNISSLYSFGLTENKLEGMLPADLGLTLPKLQEFYIDYNRFSGTLPPSLGNASNLVNLDILDNNIRGPIPNNLGSLLNIEWLSLGKNSLGENMRPGDLSFFDSLINCTHLQLLGLNTNGLIGKLPNSIVNLSTTLEGLYMYRNHLYGSIPREIGKLVNLRVLNLRYNNLTGTIPESIGELSQLGTIYLYDNSISGEIPISISNITQLSELHLFDNKLQGTIPPGLFNISTLQKLSLHYNRLGGLIPKEIMYSSQCIFLYLHDNLFTGPLPSNIGSLKHLVELYVSDNRLTGDIPTTLGGCVMLEQLHMEGNLFQGRIPSSLKALKSLQVLDLSSNNISGNIPRFFEEFHHIEYLNLSHNKLKGEVPREGLFSNMSVFSVVGNLELCGGIQALHLPACPVKVLRSKKNKISLRKILLLVLLPFGILLACLVFICYRRGNSKKLNDPVPVFEDNLFPRLSYQDLLLATNDFSPESLVGQGRYGSVYKGILESGEHLVAVKVLNVEVRGANKSFLAECETLRNIRHRNLIKIITACSSTDFKGNDFKALVFEFMPNGSVENWLHPGPYKNRERNLTLLQRPNISIDVALGVDYLHHHSHASIIHGDIKPSNILLDEEFVAHIGDFGLARFSFATTSDINQAQMSSTGVRGTVGYVPPEYGMCAEISEEGDVYSYGIFLLEMFSGKRPTESSILVDNNNNLHDYVRKALPERVMDIVDPRILLDKEEHAMEVCLASIFEVGILCSEETPRKRITISVAIKQLQAARDKLLEHRQ
ncbi:probable LRR receptor-like serine/threonine-protein kinase At3g47570 isoform X2 [Daucus carota subsp. sativus]|uniref:probable LRR receptor-like serine/threonine-protein kinase At3g47570 isoform X2 n=1 Tax=Daucus carota subsp. sativus TaxID=79200 RepID=UPI0007F045F1|nr:PREDICTED: probable LRR receptor-like serine/threonine-protein kinase At3g47570 isoform X2 [Daucus carota subsp. sativus]